MFCYTDVWEHAVVLLELLKFSAVVRQEMLSFIKFKYFYLTKQSFTYTLLSRCPSVVLSKLY